MTETNKNFTLINKGLKVLSLFDGMSCGLLAMMQLGIKIDRYIAYEIDKFAIKTSMHNFPEIEHCGDVFDADFTQYEGFDFLIGGSPCTYWSIAQTKNRETIASGMGWELFSQYVRALKEAKPKYFLYENNKSMSKAIKESISEAFGFEPILINSALVSAQNRQRLYWCGIRREDGTYRKADIEQPKDRGILLKDILETGCAWQDKSYAYTTRCQAAIPENTLEKHQHTMVAEPIKPLSDKEVDYMFRKEGRTEYGYIQKSTEDKAKCLTANVSKGVPYNCMFDKVDTPIKVGEINNGGQGNRIYSSDGKSCSITANGGGVGSNTGLYAEPVCMRYERTEEAKSCRKQYEAHEIHHGYHELHELHPRTDGKSNTLSTVLKDNPICEPVIPMNYELESVTDKDSGVIAMLDMPKGNHDLVKRVYGDNGKSPTLNSCSGGNREPKVFTELPECFRVKEATKTGYTEIEVGDCVDMAMPNSKTRRGRNMKDKSNCLQTSCSFFQYCGTVKTPIYEVKDGQITIKGKTYPIKLVDGFYIIRKLTVRECMRLQTVPEWFEFPVSNSQAYKQLGNGWTVDVIAHILSNMMSAE